MARLSLDEVRRFLAEESLFRGASPAAIDRLAEAAIERTVPRGSTFFSAGQPCDALHFVASGSGLLVKVAPDGRERILHRAIPGDMVGVVPFFDGGEYPATFVADSDCVTLSFPRDRLLSLIEDDPRIALAIIGGIVGRLRKMTTLVEKMSFEDTERRLWGYLVDGSEPSGAGEYPRVFDPLPTREHLANAIGTVREVVSRRLSALVDSGHVRIEGRRLVLLRALE
jgi:CRP/FNR family transcriptional regulator